jgi:hypothetical protein
LRAASSKALPMAANVEPPEPTTPTAANWEAPVNTSNDMAHVLATDSPLATASTPNDTPNTPTAAPRVMDAATGDARRLTPARQLRAR